MICCLAYKSCQRFTRRVRTPVGTPRPAYTLGSRRNPNLSIHTNDSTANRHAHHLYAIRPYTTPRRTTHTNPTTHKQMKQSSLKGQTSQREKNQDDSSLTHTPPAEQQAGTAAHCRTRWHLAARVLCSNIIYNLKRHMHMQVRTQCRLLLLQQQGRLVPPQHRLP